MSSKKGVVEYFGASAGGHKCGYCKGTKSDSADHGLWGHYLTPQNYQDLIDRGWRRSGHYCYKPAMNVTCCPAYTIRCDALSFKPTKSQKKIVKQVNAFLAIGTKPKNRSALNIDSSTSVEMVHAPTPKSKISPEQFKTMNKANHDSQLASKSGPSPGAAASSPKAPELTAECPKRTKTKECDTSSQRKSKEIRIEKKIKKMMARLNCSKSDAIAAMKEERAQRLSKCRPRPLEELLFPTTEKSAHELDIRFVCTCDDEYKATFDASHSVYRLYQMDVHKEQSSECTPKGYKRFLVDSPLLLEKFSNVKTSKLPTKFGTYHMQYWLDGIKLIAVGVIDILPSCISSVYLFYDPEFSFLTLGTYSALREIAIVRQLQRLHSELRFYYMGFYIHSCPKMRYKGRFSPSFLLCPEVYMWQAIEKCTPKLDRAKYSRLEEDMVASDKEAEAIADEDILIYFGDGWMNYSIYSGVRQDDEAEVREYARLVGKKSAKNMLLVRKS